jgi:diguanylate cyclase (GGDEF)-like protein
MELNSEIIEFLKYVEIFSSLTEKELEYISHFLDVRDFVEGQIIFREGDRGDSMYILFKGIINTKCKLPDGKNRDIAEFYAGDFFGEMAIFENEPRSATCYGLKPGIVIILTSSILFKLMIHNSKIALKILYNMLGIISQRLRESSQFLTNVVNWGETARKRAITDEMTGIYNRRFLDEELEIHFKNAQVRDKELSILMIDLDDFREINENYGHETGDVVIKKTVEGIREILHDKYILARYGGDEFFVILPDTSIEQAIKIAEKIRKRVQSVHVMRASIPSMIDVSASIGVAALSDATGELKSLKEVVDQALYRAKSEGKNKVVFS